MAFHEETIQSGEENFMNQLHESRLERVMSAMKDSRLTGLVISDPQSIWYLTGIFNEPYERLFVLYLSADGNHVLFWNKLFNIRQKMFPEVCVCDADDGIRLLAEKTAKTGRVGIDKSWAARFLIPLMKRNSQAEYVLGSACVDAARACKDSVEQVFMREASIINDECMQFATGFIREKITEKEVARYIDRKFCELGAQGNSFEPIVSFGKNAADPHHEPDDTVIQEGDCVLIDIGCKKNYYCSDMTRTYFFKKEPCKKYAEIHDIVREANEKAESIVRPGILLREIDAAARRHIAESGYGEFFTHRLGHFIGLSEHEQGDVSSASIDIAKPGMIFSIEPGIYLPGKFGVRIEDLVLVTEDGCEVLNKVDKHWKVIGEQII